MTSDLQTRAEAIAADPKREHSCSRLLFDLRHELLAVVRAAREARSHNHIQGWEGSCKCRTCTAIAAYDTALVRELGGEP